VKPLTVSVHVALTSQLSVPSAHSLLVVVVVVVVVVVTLPTTAGTQISRGLVIARIDRWPN